MRFAVAVALGLLLCPLAFSQTSESNPSGVSPSAPQSQPPAQSPQPPSYANYSIMLVNPAGGAVVLMHNPNNQLEFVDVKNVQQTMSAGYVPVRAVELGEFISALQQENAQLAAENTRLRIEVAKLVPPTPATPSQTELEAQQRAQIDAEKAARRQQLIQTWLMLQNMNRPQPYRLPQPYHPLPTANPYGSRLQTNCTTVSSGSMASTNCN